MSNTSNLIICPRGLEPYSGGRCEHGTNCGVTICPKSASVDGRNPERVEEFYVGLAATVFLQKGDHLLSLVGDDYNLISDALARLAVSGHLPKLGSV